MNGHTTAPIGKRVYVILHDGDSFVDKLVERRDRIFLFEARGRVMSRTIRSLSINRRSEEKRNG